MIRLPSAFLLAALAAGPALAQSNGSYAGTIRCERMAGRAASATPFQLTVEGAQAGYAREVLAVDGSPMGMNEEAHAPIAPDGALVLAAVVEAGSFHYEARYEGRLTEASGQLAGTQAWLLGANRAERKCTIALSRRAARPERPARSPQAAPPRPAPKPAAKPAPKPAAEPSAAPSE